MFLQKRQKLSLYNLTKNEIKKICFDLELAKEVRPKDRIIRDMLRKYTSYFKNFK